MNQSVFKAPLTRSLSDSTESDRSFPPTKRVCNSSSTSKLSRTISNTSLDTGSTSTDTDRVKKDCKNCGRDDTVLRTFNCPSSHDFCLNCIFSWTQTHVQGKTAPKCLAVSCNYVLKLEDLEHLPITPKDHQILLQLIELAVEQTPKDPQQFRSKCDKCALYIDQHSFYVHHNECPGRESTIPCETCYCPVLLTDYEQHMLICTNDDHATLAQFLASHVHDPSTDEKKAKLFISSWQKKHRRQIEIYELIEDFNQSNGISEPICDQCQATVPFDQLHFINCDESHAICLKCYEQHVKNQMRNDAILTCYQCSYHLQDRDLAEIRSFTNAEIQAIQDYQTRKVFESYQVLFANDDPPQNSFSTQSNSRKTVNSNSNDEGARRKCERCSHHRFYDDIFLLNCNCKICYDCFAEEMSRQQQATDQLLACPFCRSPVKDNDLGNLRLPNEQVRLIRVYQQSKLFEMEHGPDLDRSKTNERNNAQASTEDDNDEDPDPDLALLLLNQQQCFPQYWTLPMLTNFSRHVVDPQSAEYKFVADQFFESWKNMGLAPAPVPPPSTAPLPHPPPPAPAPMGPMPQSAVPSTLGSTHSSVPVPQQPHPRHPNPTIPSSSPSIHPRPMQNPVGPPVPPLPLVPFQLNHPPMYLPQPPQPSSSLPHPNMLSLSQMQPAPPANVGSNPYPPLVPTLPQLYSQLRNVSIPVNSMATNQPPQNTNTSNQPYFLSVNNPPPPLSVMLPSLSAPPGNMVPRNNVPNSVGTMQNPRRRGLPQARYRNAASFPTAGPPVNAMPRIRSIERIQNQRWFKQYAAHELEFREKLGKKTHQWLFHGCSDQAAKNIEVECFNRSYAGQHAVAYGQGCYFAKDSSYSDGFAPPDAQGFRRMFLARVLVGKTTLGNSTMRVPPNGFDTTGDGRGSIFVTYYDSQAYAEYLITYQR